MTLVEAILQEMLRVTEVSDKALAEARARRDAVFQAALTYEGAYRTIESGSIAHDTVSVTISDADGSVVLSRKVYPDYGPDGGGEGPKDLVEGIAEDMRNLVQQIYPNVWVSTNHKHAIYFRFFEPLPDGQDPTVDLVIALNRKDAPGLWIPHMGKNIWQASDPEAHTKLVSAKSSETNNVSTMVVRISKLYAKQWSPELLCSFHLTALMLESLRPGETISEGFWTLLTHASKSLKWGNTKDPAGVSEPLKIPEGRDREKLVKKLGIAADHLGRTGRLESDNDENFDAIVEKLRKVFWRSDMQEVLDTAAQKVRLDRAVERASSTYVKTPVTVAAAAITAPKQVLNTRAYAAPASLPAFSPPMTSDWYEEAKVRSWFEQGVDGSEYAVLFAGLNEGFCSYVVSIPLPEYKTTVLARIVFDGKYASVYAPGMKNLRHVNPPDPEQSLCLWYPMDDSERKWDFDKGLLALLDLTKLHIYKEFRFKETGRWPGEEVHNG